MKKETRKNLLKERDSLSKEEVSVKSNAVCEKLAKVLSGNNIQTVMTYIPSGNETDVLPVVRQLLAAGKRIVAPICTGPGIMIPSMIEDLEKDLVPGYFGILAPREERPVPLSEIDAVIVPGVGFDKKGNRLGFGGGYYDRFMPKLRQDALKVAVCYDLQILPELEPEPWDYPVDMIITESSLYHIKK